MVISASTFLGKAYQSNQRINVLPLQMKEKKLLHQVKI